MLFWIVLGSEKLYLKRKLCKTFLMLFYLLPYSCFCLLSFTWLPKTSLLPRSYFFSVQATSERTRAHSYLHSMLFYVFQPITVFSLRSLYALEVLRRLGFFCIFLKQLSFFSSNRVVSRDKKKMQSLNIQVHLDWAMTLQISFFMPFQLNLDETLHAVCLSRGDFK